MYYFTYTYMFVYVKQYSMSNLLSLAGPSWARTLPEGECPPPRWPTAYSSVLLDLLKGVDTTKIQ